MIPVLLWSAHHLAVCLVAGGAWMFTLAVRPSLDVLGDSERALETAVRYLSRYHRIALAATAAAIVMRALVVLMHPAPAPRSVSGLNVATGILSGLMLAASLYIYVLARRAADGRHYGRCSRLLRVDRRLLLGLGVIAALYLGTAVRPV